MPTGKVEDWSDDRFFSIGMHRARNWSRLLLAFLTGLAFALLRWEYAVCYVGILLLIALEGWRARESQWDHCYHATRKAMDDDAPRSDSNS